MTEKTNTKHTIELADSELDTVRGGIGLLLPAVQKVREAAAHSDADDRPTEEVSFYYNKIAFD